MPSDRNEGSITNVSLSERKTKIFWIMPSDRNEDSIINVSLSERKEQTCLDYAERKKRR